MTAFNGTPLTYDLNGNLLNDGTNIYTWDARNHLSTLTGSGTIPTNASFIYDGLGRRFEKTINQQTTAFLYDGLTSVQELAPSGLGQFVPTANMLTSLDTDEFFLRNDANGAQSFIRDALGSTLALANAAGSVSTSYTYEPFGNVSISPSPTNTNPYQFTGRENDGTGVYFYRARYYSPSTSRFLGQDPLGILRRSANLYQYVDNDPVIFADASGLEDPVCDEIREEIKKLLERRATCNHPAEYKQIEVELEFQKQAFEAFGYNEGPEGDGGGQPIPGDETPSEPEKQAAQPTQDAVLMTILLIIGRWVWVF